MDHEVNRRRIVSVAGALLLCLVWLIGGETASATDSTLTDRGAVSEISPSGSDVSGTEQRENAADSTGNIEGVRWTGTGIGSASDGTFTLRIVVGGAQVRARGRRVRLTAVPRNDSEPTPGPGR